MWPFANGRHRRGRWKNYLQEIPSPTQYPADCEKEKEEKCCLLLTGRLDGARQKKEGGAIIFIRVGGGG